MTVSTFDIVTQQCCLICGRRPSDAHHLRFAQSPALSRKVSDEFTVPLCRGHHREVHHSGDEAAWWTKAGIDPTVAARALWLETHPLPAISEKASSGPQPPQSSTERSEKGSGMIGRPVNEAKITKTKPIEKVAYSSMTSFRQIEANRRNARKSTGPITEEGKQRSRCNAVRHGLTAETVIGALEDAEDYKAFEAAIIADYDAQSAVERELVLRLASLLWRLRRATTMETGLFEIQAEHLREFKRARQALPASQEVVYALFGRARSVSYDGERHRTASRMQQLLPGSGSKSVEPALDTSVELARCFLRLANLPNFALDRLSRYEATLWRQAGQILYALDALDRRKPQERSRRLPCRCLARTADLRRLRLFSFEWLSSSMARYQIAGQPSV